MDSTQVTVADVARMAITMEEKGRSFYTWAAGNFADQEVQDMFLRLAEEEKEHARTFQKILDLPEAGQNIDPKTGRYLEMLAGAAEIFPHHKNISEELVKTPADALAVGIQAEKDSILFYHELYNDTTSSEVKEALSKLLREEKLHLMELRDSLDEMVKK